MSYVPGMNTDPYLRPKRLDKFEYRPWMAVAERNAKTRLRKLGAEPWADRTVKNYLNARNNSIDSYNHEKKLQEFDRAFVEKKKKAELEEIERKDDEECEKISEALYKMERKVRKELELKDIVEDVFWRNKYDLGVLKGKTPYIALPLLHNRMNNLLRVGLQFSKWTTVDTKRKIKEVEERIRAVKRRFFPKKKNDKLDEKLHDLEEDMEWAMLKSSALDPVIPEMKGVSQILRNDQPYFVHKMEALMFAGGKVRCKRRKRRDPPIEINERHRAPAEEVPYVDRLSGFLQQAKLGAPVSETVFPVPKRIRIYREKKKMRELNPDPRITRLTKNKEFREMEAVLRTKDTHKIKAHFCVRKPRDSVGECIRERELNDHLDNARRYCEEFKEMQKFEYFMFGEQEMFEKLDIENNEVRPPEYKHTPAPDYFPKRVVVDPEEEKRKAEKEKDDRKRKYEAGITRNTFRRTIFKLEKLLEIPPTATKPNDMPLDELCDRMSTVFEEFTKTFTGENIDGLRRQFRKEKQDILAFEREESAKEAAKASYNSSTKSKFASRSTFASKPKPASTRDEHISDEDLSDGYSTPHEMYGFLDDDDNNDRPKQSKKDANEYFENRRKNKYLPPKYDSDLEVRKTDEPLIRRVKQEVPLLAEMRDQILEKLYFRNK